MYPFFGVETIERPGAAEFLHLGHIASFNTYDNRVRMVDGTSFQLRETEMKRLMKALDTFYKRDLKNGQ